jgi:hypothetical protein
MQICEQTVPNTENVVKLLRRGSICLQFMQDPLPLFTPSIQPEKSVAIQLLRFEDANL